MKPADETEKAQNKGWKRLTVFTEKAFSLLRRSLSVLSELI